MQIEKFWSSICLCLIWCKAHTHTHIQWGQWAHTPEVYSCAALLSCWMSREGKAFQLCYHWGCCYRFQQENIFILFQALKFIPKLPLRLHTVTCSINTKSSGQCIHIFFLLYFILHKNTACPSHHISFCFKNTRRSAAQLWPSLLGNTHWLGLGSGIHSVFLLFQYVCRHS